jgi:cytochrome P450
MRHAEAIAAMQAIASQTLRHNLQVAAAGGEAENLFAWLATAESEAEIAPTLAALPLQLSEFCLLVDAAGNIATTLCAALDLLLRHPEALTRLQAEIGEQLGEESPTVEQLTQLHYTQQVVRETLRLRPPVSWLLRIAANEERIKQETIPAGALIILPIAHYQRNPVFWPNPDHFLPERFAEKPEHPLAWLAFGAGQRLCLGKDFSLITCQLILAMLIQRLEFVG